MFYLERRSLELSCCSQLKLFHKESVEGESFKNVIEAALKFFTSILLGSNKIQVDIGNVRWSHIYDINKMIRFLILLSIENFSHFFFTAMTRCFYTSKQRLIASDNFFIAPSPWTDLLLDIQKRNLIENHNSANEKISSRRLDA